MAASGINNGKGGYVLNVPGTSRAIVVANKNQDDNVWENAHYYINMEPYHDTAGKKFKDWRLPTREELSLIYEHRAAIGGFSAGFYWSSTANVHEAWGRDFGSGAEDQKGKEEANYKMRAVRDL